MLGACQSAYLAAVQMPFRMRPERLGPADCGLHADARTLCRTLYGETQELVHEWIAVAVYVADELLLVPETHAEGIWKRPRLHSGGKVWLSTDHELGDGPFSATQNT